MKERQLGGVEWQCLQECLRFSLRHPRYLLIFLILYWYSVRDWRGTRAARYGYCFLQLFDDIMDGDRRVDTAADIIAEQTIAAWTTGQFRSDTTLARLGAAFSEALRSLPVLPGDDARHDVLVLLQAMRLDATRIATKNVLTRAEIKDQLRCTFHHSLNILLIGAGLRTRAAEVPDLMESLGWCSVVRDLAEDLARGLVNVPSDVVAQVRAADGELTGATSGGSTLVGGGKDRGAAAPREVADRARRDRGRGAERGPATRHVSALH